MNNVLGIKKQRIQSLRNLTIEETYELAEEILNNNLDGVKEEIGDVMLHLASMRTYLLRKRIMGYHKANYQKIIKYTKLLMKHEGDNEALKKLKNTILQDEFTEKEWFLEQA